MSNDPKEMLNKIRLLEKDLPNVNRPETLYARAHLMQAEASVMGLVVLIDIAQKLERLNESIVDLNRYYKKIFTPTLHVPAEEIERPARYMNPDIWCTQCNQLVRRDPDDYLLFCKCEKNKEGGTFPSYWRDADEVMAQMDDQKYEDPGDDRPADLPNWGCTKCKTLLVHDQENRLWKCSCHGQDNRREFPNHWVPDGHLTADAPGKTSGVSSHPAGMGPLPGAEEDSGQQPSTSDTDEDTGLGEFDADKPS